MNLKLIQKYTGSETAESRRQESHDLAAFLLFIFLERNWRVFQLVLHNFSDDLRKQILDIEVRFGGSDDVSQIQLIAEISDCFFFKFPVFFVRFIRRDYYRPGRR